MGCKAYPASGGNEGAETTGNTCGYKSGGPDGATEVFLSYMYKQAYTNSTYGYGMAIGVVVFSFSFALSAIVNAVTKRETLEF